MRKEGEIVELGRCEKGEQIAFGPRGLWWEIIHKAGGEVLNAVLQIRNENGTTRTYGSCDRRWKREVIRLQRRE